MIRDALIRARLALQKNKRLQQSANERAAFKTRGSALCETLDELRGQIVAEREARGSVAPSCGMTPDFVSRLDELLEAVREHMQNGVLEERDVKRAVALKTQHKTSGDKCWQRDVGAQAGNIAATLKAFQEFAEDPQAAASACSSIKAGQRALPRTAEEVRQFALALRNGQKIAASVDASEAVRDFVSRMAENRATLADVSPEILLWIEERQLTGRIRLSMNAHRSG